MGGYLLGKNRYISFIHPIIIAIYFGWFNFLSKPLMGNLVL